MSSFAATPPLVSVVMAVKNGGQIMRQAIHSILTQSMIDFEFIIINDGSSDDTLEVLSEYNDSRIKVFNQENQGLSRSLNRGLKLATGKYIARQDHDDISLANRLQMQVDYLESNPECGLVGTAAEIWRMDQNTGRAHDHPVDCATLCFDLLFNNPFVHTSWMFRRDVIEKVGYYSNDPKREPPEDYEYVSRLARVYKVANLSERLVIYREFPNSLSSESRESVPDGKRPFNEKLALISAENIAFFNELTFNDPRVVFFGCLTHSYYPGLTQGVSFRDLESILRGAVSKIEKRFGLILDQNLINNRLNTLRYQYLKCGVPSKIDLLFAFFSADGVNHFFSLVKRYVVRVRDRILDLIRLFFRLVFGKR